MKKLKVGHMVHCYLNTTENWCYRLMRHLPDVTQQVITTKLKNEASFPLQDAEFIVAPLARLAAREVSSLWGAVIYRLQWALLPFWRLALLRRVRSLDVLHAHFSVVGWDFLWLARRLSLPLVVSFYGFDYEWLPRNQPEWANRYQILFRQAELFITEGDFGRKTLIGMGCPAEKVKVVHLGIDPSSVPVCRREKRPETLRLVQIATFSEKKGYDVTVEAFARALTRCPNMTLTLVGNDPDQVRTRIEGLIRELGIGERVVILDGVPFEKLYGFLAEFDVFIHPSRYTSSGNSEGGAPVVLLDAQAAGLPVLATTHCDIPDEVLDGETGLLAQERDPEQLARNIERFYHMADLEYQLFSCNARWHVEREYDVLKSAALLRRIYVELVQGKAMPAR